MIREDFIDFLTEKETLSKFKTTDKGTKFRKATPKQVAAVILCVLKNKQDGKYFYGDRTNAVMSHRSIHKLIANKDKYKETDIELTGKDADITEKTIYSILNSYKFFNPNKTKDRYVFRNDNGKTYFYIDNEHGKHYNNWRIFEDKLCSFLGWYEPIYEEEEKTIEERVEILEKKQEHTDDKIDEISKVIEDFKTTDNEVYLKKIEVLHLLNKSDEFQRSEWKTFFINCKQCNCITRTSKEGAQSALKSIEEYERKKVLY